MLSKLWISVLRKFNNTNIITSVKVGSTYKDRHALNKTLLILGKQVKQKVQTSQCQLRGNDFPQLSYYYVCYYCCYNTPLLPVIQGKLMLTLWYMYMYKDKLFYCKLVLFLTTKKEKTCKGSTTNKWIFPPDLSRPLSEFYWEIPHSTGGNWACPVQHKNKRTWSLY